MSDKPYFHETDHTIHLRVWALGQMVWGAFLGSAVVRELAARGHDVTCLQRSAAGHGPEVREVLGDITDPVAVGEAVSGQDAVVHLAARVSMVGPWAEFERAQTLSRRSLLPPRTRKRAWNEPSLPGAPTLPLPAWRSPTTSWRQ